MQVRGFVIALLRLAGSALAAFLLWFALVHSPLWPRSVQAQPHEASGEKKSAEKHVAAEPEKKSALDHVLDTPDWELFDSFGPGHFRLPKILGLQLTKFMVLEVVAALLVIAVYVPLSWSLRDGHVPRGSFANFFEVLLVFVRDQVAKPSIGEHDADRHVPFLWTMFLFILFNNLLGLVPLFGSATGSIYCTLALALWVFFYMHGNAVSKMGFGHYVVSLWPNIDLPLFPMGLPIKLLIFAIEWIGVLVRNLVLAVRLFANVFAGHMVLATFLLFIWMAQTTHPVIWGSVTMISVLAIIALSLLELFIAFLQAYVFTFLTALFLGMALHPEH
jgi:F-type H+-transporting ATPase subunit a